MKTASEMSLPEKDRDIVEVSVAAPDVARGRQTATLLEDGTVLVVGGRGYTGTGTLARADRFDPVASTFRDGGSLATARHDHAAIRLADGKVLVTGGWDQSTAGTGFDPVLRTTERYDPGASAFTTGPEMVFPRRHHTMTLLEDGRVLVAGGIQLRGSGFGASPNTETYDPAADAFTEGPRMVASSGRWLHSATRLADGRVLVAGGRDNNCRDACPLYALASAEIYDPATGTFAPTGSLNVSRYGHSAALLPDGRVLVLGGATFEDLGTPGDAVTAAEVWDPATGAFSRAGSTREGRAFHALAPLNDGRLLLVGGQNANGSPTTASGCCGSPWT